MGLSKVVGGSFSLSDCGSFMLLRKLVDGFLVVVHKVSVQLVIADTKHSLVLGIFFLLSHNFTIEGLSSL